MCKLRVWGLSVSVALFFGFITSYVFANPDRDTIPLNKKRGTPTGDDAGTLSNTKSPEDTPPPVENPLVRLTKPAAVGAKKKDAEVQTPSDGDPQPYVASLEAYGSSRVNLLILKDFLGGELDAWIEKGLAADPSSLEDEKKLADKIKRHFNFAFVAWEPVEFFEPNNLAVYITLNVVEPEDVKKRMNFFPEPRILFADSGGLIKLWMVYEEKGLVLVESGELELEGEKCQAFHCPFGHKHGALKKYEKVFVEGVKKYETDLVKILVGDKRPEWRASAAYLLPYLKDGKKVVSLMLERLRDPDVAVRNNALRVLGDIAEFHPEYVIALKPLIEALDYPYVSDRSKALFVIHLMSLNSRTVRTELVRDAVPNLLKVLASTQPDHRDYAHAVLRKISGKNFQAADNLAWTSWYERLPKNREVSKK